MYRQLNAVNGGSFDQTQSHSRRSGGQGGYIQLGRKILMHMRGHRLKGSTHACASCKHVVDRVALVSLSTVW